MHKVAYISLTKHGLGICSTDISTVFINDILLEVANSILIVTISFQKIVRFMENICITMSIISFVTM